VAVCVEGRKRGEFGIIAGLGLWLVILGGLVVSGVGLGGQFLGGARRLRKNDGG